MPYSILNLCVFDKRSIKSVLTYLCVKMFFLVNFKEMNINWEVNRIFTIHSCDLHDIKFENSFFIFSQDELKDVQQRVTNKIDMGNAYVF